MQIDVDKTCEVAIVVADHLRHLAHGNIRDIPERNRPSVGGHNGYVFDLVNRVDVLRRILDAQRNDGVIFLFDRDDVVASDRIANGVHGFVNGDGVFGHTLEVVSHIDVVPL